MHVGMIVIFSDFKMKFSLHVALATHMAGVAF